MFRKHTRKKNYVECFQYAKNGNCKIAQEIIWQAARTHNKVNKVENLFAFETTRHHTLTYFTFTVVLCQVPSPTLFSLQTLNMRPSLKFFFVRFFEILNLHTQT